MTIEQCMNAALQLVNQYSIAGVVVPSTYNDQADMKNRMVNLINDAQMEIATTVRPIDTHASFSVSEPAVGEPTTDVEIVMPQDFNHAISIYFTPASGGQLRAVDANNYKWIDDRTLLVPSRPAGTYRIVYNRFPIRYDASTPVTTVLDNKPDTHEIIPYFVGAMLALDENPKTYYGLYNVWETRLTRLGQKPAHAVNTLVEDVYGFDSFGGLY